MFYYLDGTVAEILPYLAVIDCGGVGYACKTTNYTLASLKKGQRGKIYTYLNVGEEVFDLYGFSTQSELNSFKLLLGVSGVGPKAALAILSSGTPESLAMAIVTGDEKRLTAAPGIGKKIAQRIILELKDKMARRAPGGWTFQEAERPLQCQRPIPQKLPKRHKPSPRLAIPARKSAWRSRAWTWKACRWRKSSVRA